ncbi:unnamed protein product [Trichobilharzia szidati]|nr:unnamed protein product [Trichobilharzia szidati]
MDQSLVNELTNCLQHTLSPDRESRKSAESYLKAVELRPSYCICLLRILQDSNVPLPTRMAAAITLKNFIKNRWHVDPEETDHIQASDREGLRNQLIGAMLAVSGNLQPQLSEAISTIWREDFPHRWPNLIPELVQRMAQLGADLSMVHGVLYTAHTLFKRYRHECAGSELYTEMKLVIGQFGAPLTELAKNLLALVVGGSQNMDPSRLVTALQCLLLVCKIFLSLNCQDLPEFFEDNMQDWMSFFRSLLQLNSSSLNLTTTSGDSGETNGIVLVEQIKSQVCDNASLYASKYEPEFATYLPGFVTDVWEMLLGTGAQTKYDLLIGNAINFLSSVISRPQHRYLFENPETLQKLCEKVILPNMHFRALDEELFTESPDEYIRLDLEGSNAQTRRRAACNLVHVLCEAFEGPVVTNFSTYIEHLLNEYANTPSGGAWTSKDAALLLVTSVASRGKTEKHGVTISTGLVNLTTFFENHVLPELQNPDVNYLPVIKADCLRYAIAFRSLLPPMALVSLLNMTPNLVMAAATVVQSYVAAVIDKLLAMRRPDSPSEPLILKEQVADPQLLIDRLLAILNNPECCESVYVMRALMRVCCCLQERCLPSMNNLVTTLLARLTQVTKNPSKPDFNHFLFETICLCIRLTCAADPNSVVHFEAAFLPIFQDILQQDVVEFVPYVFQLISVMLEQYPSSQTVQVNCKPQSMLNGSTTNPNSLRPSQAYSALLQRILVPSLWEPSRNVPSLVRLLQAYLLHDMDDVLSENKISPIMGVFQKLASSSTNEVHAFALLNALLLAGPKDTMMPNNFRQIFMVIFRRLQTCKTERFLKAFASFIAHFVLIYSPNELITLVDGIQSNIFSRVLEKVLIPYAEAIITNPLIPSIGFGKSTEASGIPSTYVCTQWRENSIGLIRFIGEAQALLMDGATYRASWLPLLTKIISGLANGPNRGGDTASDIAVSTAINSMVNGFSKDERFIEMDSDPSGQSAYSQLTFAVQRLPDLCASITDPRIYLAKTLHDLSNQSPGKMPVMLNSISEQPITAYLQSIMGRAQLCIN